MKNSKSNVLVFIGLADYKLASKIDPILGCSCVKKLYLVRRHKYGSTNPKIIQYNMPYFFRALLPLTEIFRLIEALYILLFKKIDVIIGFHLIMHGLYGYLFSILFNKRFVMMFVESPEEFKKKWLLLKILKRASLIGVRGNRSSEYLKEIGVASKKLFIPPNEFNMPKLSKKDCKKEYDVIYVGHFIERKDPVLWVEVIDSIKKSIPDVRAIMLGDGPLLSRIKELVNEKDLGQNIKLLGRLSREEADQYFSRSKVHLMTTRSEGLPMVVVEGMALGVPAVVPNSPGDFIDIIDSGKNGYIVDSREPHVISDRVVKLISDTKLYKKFSNSAIEKSVRLSKESSKDRLVRLWEKKFTEILS